MSVQNLGSIFEYVQPGVSRRFDLFLLAASFPLSLTTVFLAAVSSCCLHRSCYFRPLTPQKSTTLQEMSHKEIPLELQL